MQSFLDSIRVLSDRIVKFRFAGNLLLVLEVAHEAAPKKMKSMVVSRSRIYAPGYGDLTPGGEELEKLKSLHIYMITLDS